MLVLAAHPDDETLATAGLLQRAMSVGAGVRVVLVTDGENNPWAQRASERRLRIGPSDRARFGARRRAECLVALHRLGVPEACVHFLALGDQNLTRRLITATAPTAAALVPHLLLWRPTVVIAPTAADLHPDHSALAVLTRLVLARHPGPDRPRELAYLIHNPELRQHAAAVTALSLSAAEKDRKLAAILCHRSQLHLRGSWLRSFAGEEAFLASSWPAGAPHPAVAMSRDGDEVAITIRTHPRLRSFGARTLLVLAESPATGVVALAVGVPAFTGGAAVRSPGSAAVVAEARFSGGPTGGGLRIPGQALPPWQRAFVKLERRFGFFDEAGWREFPAPT